MGRQFDAVHARHADIGQHDVDRLVAQDVECRQAVASLADDLARQLPGNVGEQGAQAVAGQRLVIDDENLQRGGLGWRRWHGRIMRTS